MSEPERERESEEERKRERAKGRERERERASNNSEERSCPALVNGFEITRQRHEPIEGVECKKFCSKTSSFALDFFCFIASNFSKVSCSE